MPWGKFYETWGQDSYDGEATAKRVEELFDDPAIRSKKNIYQYILGGEQETQLLDVRLFNESIKREVYKTQTSQAKKNGVSNCPDCALSSKEAEKKKIYTIKQMEADHVTPWSKGGSTTKSNCVMLCKRHNKVKGNK